MKQILLVAAIYSLVLHQSRKNSKAHVFRVTPKIEIQTASLAVGFYSYMNSVPKYGESDYKFARGVVHYRSSDKD